MNGQNLLRAMLIEQSGYACGGAASEEMQRTVRVFSSQTFYSDFIAQFGDSSDGIVEYIGTAGPTRHFETGYYYGAGKPRNIVNVSPQVGCPAACQFCELGGAAFSQHLNPASLFEQVALMLRFALERVIPGAAGTHKINVAKSGDILFHPYALECVEALASFGFRMKLSTVFPSGRAALRRFEQLAEFAATFAHPIQWQISLISTDERERLRVAGSVAAGFRQIADAGEIWRSRCPSGRKINLSLILHEGSTADVEQVRELFPPELFHFRFRPYVPTENGKTHQLVRRTSKELREIPARFKDAGYDVDEWATPTPTEWRFGLSSNSTLELYRTRLLRAGEEVR